MPMPKRCPDCQTKDSLTSIGPGVERVAEEAQAAFPDARVEVLSSDTAGNPVELAERMRRMETYQTLVQVAGRAGRADKPGHALIQTHQPEHEALIALAAGDREMFIGVELAMREMLGLPPFGKLAAVIFWGPEAAKVDALAKKFLNAAPRAEGIEILGPSEAPIGRLRGLYRRRLFIQAEANVNLSKYMQTWRKKLRPPSKYKIQIDIDPQSFM